MHIRFTKRGVTTLLLLALLIVTVAIVLPIVASAAGASANSGEIEDFAYQTLTGADVTVDEQTIFVSCSRSIIWITLRSASSSRRATPIP
ncbi:MAG: hypothetical protein J5958_08270 [Clostridia bacterium]|nr:hypothetical protein [Clostridia bacterium]MBR5044260.1 hypothetical protein [Clostridia bacterium]